MDDRRKRDREDRAREIVEKLIAKHIEPIMTDAAKRLMDRVWRDVLESIAAGKRDVEREKAQPNPSQTTCRKKARRNAKTTMIAKRVTILTTGPEGAVAFVDDHPSRIELGNSLTLVGMLRLLTSKRGDYDRADGLVPVKSQVSLAKRVAAYRGSKIDDFHTVRAHVMRLRKALEHAGLPTGLIETVGDGYRFRLAGDGQVVIDGEIVE